MSTEDKGYQGWTNYETWAVALWNDNERGSYDLLRDVVLQDMQESYDKGERDAETLKRDAAWTGAQFLKEQYVDGAPDLGCSVYSDMLSAALSAVNWYEIGQHCAEDVYSELEREEGAA